MWDFSIGRSVAIMPRTWPFILFRMIVYFAMTLAYVAATASTDFVRKPCSATANRTSSEFNGEADKSPIMTAIGYARVSTGGQDTETGIRRKTLAFDLLGESFSAEEEVKLCRAFHIRELDVVTVIHKALGEIEFEINRGKSVFCLYGVPQTPFEDQLTFWWQARMHLHSYCCEIEGGHYQLINQIVTESAFLREDVSLETYSHFEPMVIGNDFPAEW